VSSRPWTRLTSPDERVPADERRSAQLLSGLLFVLVTAGLASGFVQLAVVPGFWPTFVRMTGALAVLAGAYALSRTRRWKVAAGLAAIAPILATAAVGMSHPADRVWYAFSMIGVLLATTFLSWRVAASVGLFALATIGAVVLATPVLHDARSFVPPIAFHGVFTPLLILGAAHRERVAREREDVLRASEQRYATLVHDSPDAIISLAADGRLLDCNPATEHIVGLPREALLGRAWGELGFSDTDAARLVEPGDGQQPALVLAAIDRPDGRRVWVESVGRRVARAAGTSIEVGMRDVSERVRAQAERDELNRQLDQARRMETLGQLAGGVAHDFNNLLMVILSSAELSKRRYPDEELIDDIIAASDRASALTSSLLAFARRRPMAPIEVALDDVIRDLERILRNLATGKLVLEVALAAEGGFVLADPTQLEQVVVNLVANARDAMPDGGTVRIATRTTQAAGAAVVELTVSDDGPGMDREIAARVFEPFFTTKAKGTGLGLATAYGIVTQSGGRIRVESVVGRGTAFIVELPRVAGDGRAPTTAPPIPRVVGRTRALLIEDEPTVQRSIAELLKAAGFDVVTAGDADEALRVHDQHRASIRLIVSDVLIPHTSGPKIVARLGRPDLPVLYLSGYAADELGDLGGARLLTKPFTSAQLVAAIDATLREHDAASPAALGTAS
jgi:PAS domain S-box-containing protein